jgi:CRP/FNR family transcriptional regulator, cyclic AMP receptor protein
MTNDEAVLPNSRHAFTIGPASNPEREIHSLIHTNRNPSMLGKVSLFAGLPLPLLEELETLCVSRRYAKNTVLFMEGDENNQLFVVRSGKVSVFLQGEEGKQLILNYMSEGEYFGELSLIDSQPRSASIMTVTDCEFLTLSREKFQEFVFRSPELCIVLMQELTARIRQLTQSVKDLALLDVYGRVAHTLEKMSDASGAIRNPKPTHQDIANMVGSSREMVSRIMKELIVGEYIEQTSDAIFLRKALPKGW